MAGLITIQGEQLTLTDNRFYVTSDGEFCPSVTTILQAYPKGAAYYEWLKKVGHEADEIVTEAGERGSAVHDLTERLDKGEEISLLNESKSMRFSALEWAMVERYVDFSRRFQPEHLIIEEQVIDPELGEAGTIDRIMRLRDKVWVMDIKTSNYIWDTHWLQVAAYRRMAERRLGLKIDGVAILHLNAATRTLGRGDAIQGIKWQLLMRDDTSEDIQVFDHVKALWRSMNKNIVPKTMTLSVKHKL